MARTVYLHGFASGAGSQKARFFREKLAFQGRGLEIPDLTGGDFERLTIGGQLRVLESLLAGDAATLIGSSLGGYLAALYAARHPEVERLVLLAPAFRFAEHWQQTLGAEALRRWRETGFLPVYHYGEQRMRNLGYGFAEESARWEPEPVFGQPARIFHGLHDSVVPAAFSQGYAEGRPNVRLTLVDSDHELRNVLAEVWAAAEI